jgi:hypothetical protein
LRFRTTWIVALVVLVLGAWVYWHEVRGGREKAARRVAAAKLVAIDPAQVSAIRINHSGILHELQKRGADWFLVRPLPAPADARAVAAFLDTLAAARREDDVGKGNLPRYGLDAPAAVVEIEAGDRSRKLQLGRINPQQTLVYTLVDDDASVVLTTSAILTQSLANAFGWRDKRVVEVSPADVDRIVMRTAMDGTVALRKDARFGWRVDGGVPWRVDPVRCEGILLGFAQLTAVGIGAENKADRAGFGLQNTDVGVTLESSGRGLADVAVGFADGKGGYFAMVAEKPEIFVIDGRLFDAMVALTRDPRDRKALWPFVPEQIDRIQVEAPDDRFELRRRSAQEWKVVASTRFDSTFALGTGMVDALLIDLATLEVADFPPTQPAASLYDPPRVEVRLFAGAREVSGIALGRKDPRGLNAFARAPGEPAVFLLSPAALLKVPFDLERLEADDAPAPEGTDRG